MNISAAGSAVWAKPSVGTATRSASLLDNPASASVASTRLPTLRPQAPAGSSHIDFESATRQEVFDWMNGEILAGRMTVDESTPFLGMTLKMSAATFQPIDMATDSERLNYFEKARLGIEWADEHGQRDQAAHLRHAVDIMRRVGMQSSTIDVLA